MKKRNHHGGTENTEMKAPQKLRVLRASVVNFLLVASLKRVLKLKTPSSPDLLRIPLSPSKKHRIIFGR